MKNQNFGIEIEMTGITCSTAAKEDLLYKALKVNVSREHYCQKMDTRFLDEINNRPPMSMDQFKSMWYDGEDCSYRHYDDTRYHALNLHSVFYKGTIEFRLFNSTLLAGEICSVHRQKHLLRILKFQSKIFGGMRRFIMNRTTLMCI